MSKDADPLQGVVTRRDCAHSEGSAVPSAPLPAEVPAPELESYIADKLREARRCKRMAERACAPMPVEYWTGHIVALVNLRRQVRRITIKQAPAGNS